jgi:hypothetical protein
LRFIVLRTRRERPCRRRTADQRDELAPSHGVPGAENHAAHVEACGVFIRRFLIHVLPTGFHRIRYYGLLASPSRAANVARARELLATPLLPVD